MISSTKAIVLSKKNYGDTSLICNLFSNQFGKITVIAKGAKSIKNPLGALLQPLNYIDCVYYYKTNRNIQTLTEASLLKKYYRIEKKFIKMQYALTVLDVVNQATHTAYPSEIIFRLTYKTLENINNEDVDKIDILFIFFQLQYLRYLGYDPSIKYCVNCNTKLLNAIFDYTAGQLLCLNCSNNKSDIKFNQEEFGIVQFLMNTHITKIVSTFKYDIQKCKMINNFLFKFMMYHLPDVRKSKALKALYHGN